MQRTPAIAIGVVVALLIIVIALIGLMLGRGQAEPSPSTSVSPSSAASSPSPSLNAEMLDRSWTVLWIGTDVNAARAERGESANTDALLLASLSADQSTLSLVSLPRDTVDVPLAEGGSYSGKINGLYGREGVDELVSALETLYDLPIDGHIVLDMDDFARLIDAVGGVDVNPPEPLVDPVARIDLQPGEQEIDAATALAYVRTRVDQDYGRMARQQEVLMALVERLVDPETDVDLGALLDGLDSLETDLPLDELPTLAELARRAANADVQMLVIRPPLITFEGDRGDGRGYILEPDVEAIRSAVQELVAP